MKKKPFLVALALFLTILLVACGNDDDTTETEAITNAGTEEIVDEAPTDEEAIYDEIDEAHNALLTASNEEIQQAVIDALNEADKEVYREVRSFSSEQDFIAELLGVEPTVIFEVLNQGVRSGNLTTRISIQRLDRVGNDIPQRDASEDIFSHWDFIYEIDDDGILRLMMRHHFDIEADMSGVTRENFDAIEVGMTLDDVSSLLGSEGTLGVTSDNHEVRTWSREFGGGTTVIISIYFIDNQVTSKAQVGW